MVGSNYQLVDSYEGRLKPKQAADSSYSVAAVSSRIDRRIGPAAVRDRSVARMRIVSAAEGPTDGINERDKCHPPSLELSLARQIRLRIHASLSFQPTPSRTLYSARGPFRRRPFAHEHASSVVHSLLRVRRTRRTSARRTTIIRYTKAPQESLHSKAQTCSEHSDDRMFRHNSCEFSPSKSFTRGKLFSRRDGRTEPRTCAA